MVGDGARLPVTVFALSLLLFAAVFRLFRHRIFGGIARALSAFEIVCFATFLFALCLPTFLYNVSTDKYSHLDGTDARIEMVVREVYSEAEYYTSFVGDVRAANLDDADFGVTVYAPFAAEIKANDIIVFDAHLTDVDKTELDSSRAYFKRNNILFSAEANANGLFLCLGEDESVLTRTSFSNRYAGYMLDFRLAPREAALAKALVLGDRSYLPDVLNRDFSRIGISHILALSGMHLTLIIGIYLFFAKRLIRCRTLVRISVIPLTLFILLFTGLSSSLLRASLMLIVSYIGLIMKKRPDSLTVLFFILFIILAVDPYSVFDIGLILSFSSVFGILLLMPYFSALKLKVLKHMHGGFVVSYVLPFIYDSFTLSFSACAFTFPAMFFFFDSASLIGILSTFIFTPLIVLYIIISLLVFVFYNIPAVCTLISHAASLVYGIIEKISGELSSFDNICVSCHDPLFWVAFLLIAVALGLAVLKNSLRAHFAALVLAAHVIFVLFALGASLLRFEADGFERISGGDGCSFIATASGKCTVIDLSDGGSASAEAAARGVFEALHTELDTLVLSDYGAKHLFMLRRLNSYLPIKQLLLPIPLSVAEEHLAFNILAFTEQNGIELDFFESGEAFEVSGVGITVMKSRANGAVAVNVSHNQKEHLLLNGDFVYATDDTFRHFAGRADVVYLSPRTTVPRSVYGKDTLVFAH